MPSSSQRLLVLVLTYPHPSTKYQEIVCTAAITETGQWVRLYPIPLRVMPSEQRLRKWHWIEIETSHARNDNRPESRNPLIETVRILEKLDSKKDREERRRLINLLPSKTLNELEAGYEYDKTSLGVITPTRVIGIEVEPEDADWTEAQSSALSQMNLFADAPPKLEKIPFRFRYIFKCEDSLEPHRLTIRDWELGVLFLKMRDQYGEQQAIEKVKEKYLNQMCAPDKDTRFFVGTMYPYNQWMVIGVFWPPLNSKMIQSNSQLEMEL